jgi:hypothetical protein
MADLFATSPLFAELQARGWFPAWLALVLGLLAVLAVGALYIKEAGRLAIGTRVGMACVRMAIVLLVAFLLVRPVLVSEDRGSRPRPVSVLIDVSQSMDSRDPRPSAADQWRAAIAFGVIDPDRGLPSETDLTSSMSEKIPDRPRRVEVARAALTNPRLSLFPRLVHAAGPFDVFTFGVQRTGKSWAETGWLKDLKAEEPRTALVESAFDLINRDDTDAPGAILLVTDGRENAGPKSLADLQNECARRKIPIHVYGVGSSAYGQLRLRDVVVPETMFVDDYVSVTVRYSVQGIAEGRVDIALTYDGREVAAKRDIPVRQGDDLKEVLTFVPQKSDAQVKKQELTATVTVTPTGRANQETLSDSLTKPSLVVDKKFKVLVVDSLPRYDFKYLQRALLRDRRVEAKFYLTEGDKQAMRSGPPWLPEFARELNETLSLGRDEFRKIIFEFDLIILGDVPKRFFSREQQQIIREFVTEGGGLIHIAGRWHAPAGWADDKNTPMAERSPIGEILPVELEPVRFPIQDPVMPDGFVPVLAPAAARSQIVTLADDPTENAELWGKPGETHEPASDRQLRPMYWYYPVKKTRPAADVYLTHPTAKTPDNKPMPLLVGHFFGRGYVIFVGFDDTWRWRFNTQETLFGRFWGQVIYQAGKQRTLGTKLTQLSLDATDPTLGTSGQIYARIFDENFHLLTRGEVEATLEHLDADPNAVDRTTTILLTKLPGQDGEYVAPIPFNKVGRFKLTVDPRNNTPAELDYRVSLPPDHEMAPGGLDEAAMRKLCDGTGGTFFREEDLHQLPEIVKPQASAFSRREETLLWNRWALFALVGLLTLEWVLRKWNGLS